MAASTDARASGDGALAEPAPAPELVVCISDLHGNIGPLQRLWAKLEAELGAALSTAVVVFLGDLCDRGPHTKEVMEFVANLVEQRGAEKTIVLAGNHDLGMAAFLQCLPADTVHDDLDATRPPAFTTGFWAHRVEGGMHYVGRRWGGSQTHQAEATFKSYGVPWRSDDDEAKHATLVAAVPQGHRKLLASMRLVCDIEVPWAPGRMVCVHAGLLDTVSAEAQIAALKARDLTASVLLDSPDDLSRYPSLTGRRNVLRMPPDLEGKALLVSGHHGFFSMDGDRIINDRSGGHVSASKPLEAVVFGRDRRDVISAL